MATVRKRTLKDGSNSYNIQVKFKNKGSGRQVVETTTWRPPYKMTLKQEEKAVQVFADNFEKQIKASMNGGVITNDSPKISFREYAKKWLERVKSENSLNYYTRCKDSIELSNEYIGGYKICELTPAIIQGFYDKLDKLKKKKSNVFPKKEFRKVLEESGYNYMRLRYEINIQSCTLSNALNGKAVSKNWSKDLSERIGIPFEKLFQEKVIEEPYAYETIHQIKRTIRAILAVAKKNRLVEDNYASADYIKFPKRPTKKIEYMNDEDAKRFFKFILEYAEIRYKTAMLLFLLTGFRRGEVAGLEWKDIDFDNNEITINRSVTTVKGYGMIEKDPKTETSKRTITVSSILIETLKEYQEWQINRRNQLGDYMEENDYLFTQENGKRLYPSTFTGWMNKMLREANIDHYSLHSLRHTNITLQLVAGVPLVTVSARAGHARTSTTSDTYAYVLKSSERGAAKMLDNVFMGENNFDKPMKQDDQRTVEEFRKIKKEMQQMGFESIKEYYEYLEFIELKAKQ